LRKFIAAFSAFILFYGCGSTTKKQVGMNGKTFFPCPSSPNCVSSTEESSHFIEAIPYSNISTQKANNALIEILKKDVLCKIITKKERYVHAEFRSKVFSFVDDVEFYFPADKKLIHVKSASRTGYYDFGKNRDRIKQITILFTHVTQKKKKQGKNKELGENLF